MEHLQIAYDLLVIMIGFAALSMTVFWTLKTRESDRRNFCIVYALFTLVLIILVLKKYLFLNVETYSPQAWYFISGLLQLFQFAVIVTAVHFLLGVYQVRFRKALTFIFLVITLVCYGLILSPLGAVLVADTRAVRLGIGFQIASVWYFVSFTLMLGLGYSLVPRPRLVQLLNDGLSTERKLTLVSAPAGFGKTTLVVDWLKQIDIAAAWLSLDEANNDLPRFLAYLAAAFQQVHREHADLLSTLRSPQLPAIKTENTNASHK